MKYFRWLPLVGGVGLLGGLLACRPAAGGAASPASPPSPPSPGPAAPPTPPAAAELIRFERTACYGPCPVDVLTIFADGRMRYDGRQNAPRAGLFAGQLAARERTALTKQFEAAQFFSFAPAYTSRATDLPTYYLTYSAGGRSLRVKDYDQAPARLKSLEASLEKLIEAPRWRAQQ